MAERNASFGRENQAASRGMRRFRVFALPGNGSDGFGGDRPALTLDVEGDVACVCGDIDVGRSGIMMAACAVYYQGI